MKLKVFNITIEIKYTFLILLTVLLYRKPVTTFTALLSIFIHETGHILAILLTNNKICTLKIGAFGFNIEKTTTNSDTEQRNILISSVGPLTNLIASIIFYLVYVNNTSYNNYFYLLYKSNFLLFLLNTLPIRGLDGGQIFCNFLTKKSDPGIANKVLTIISVSLIIPIMALSLFITIKYNYNLSLNIIVLYLISIIIFKFEKPL